MLHPCTAGVPRFKGCFLDKCCWIEGYVLDRQMLLLKQECILVRPSLCIRGEHLDLRGQGVAKVVFGCRRPPPSGQKLPDIQL